MYTYRSRRHHLAIVHSKWAYFRYKLSLSNPSGGGTSNALEGMRMKAKIHPTAEPVWTT